MRGEEGVVLGMGSGVKGVNDDRSGYSTGGKEYKGSVGKGAGVETSTSLSMDFGVGCASFAKNA